jgi:hypothetical protein
LNYLKEEMKDLSIAAIILVIIILLIFHSLTNTGRKDNYSVPRTIILRDTIIKEIVYEPRELRQVHGRKTYRGDSIHSERPFRSEMDTVIGGDTISLIYDFPENTFSGSFSRKRDTIRIEQMREIPLPPAEEEEWWVMPVVVTGSIIIGYLLGASIN